MHDGVARVGGGRTAEHRSHDTFRNAGSLDAERGGYTLLVVNDAGFRVVPLPTIGTLVVGRSSAADVRVADAQMSRQHARIHVAKRFHIEDLNSANGTMVSGCRLDAGASQVFQPGEAIMVGSTTMLVRGLTAQRRDGAGPSGDGAHRSADRPAEPVIGEVMKAAMALADRAAASMLSVLLLGETGVGKDVFAERIHRASPHANGPLLRLNCAALSPALLASELFGHEKGAFTGATCAQPGLLQSASGGTVFFDEIGDLPLDLQAKLLLVLERREVLPVGAVRPRPIDARFIAATNRDLLQDIAAGTFRRDLYHRLNGVTIELPPLRARVSEIAGLAHRFAADAARSIGRPPPELDEHTLAALRRYTWPGNVRELRAVIDRAVLLGSDGVVRLPLLGPEGATSNPAAAVEACTTVVDAGAQAPHELVEALASCGGNQSRAARVLGISRNTLIARIAKYGLARPLLPRGRP
jgi:two-component system, NtrC family, response regulator AtoC